MFSRCLAMRSTTRMSVWAALAMMVLYGCFVFGRPSMAVAQVEDEPVEAPASEGTEGGGGEEPKQRNLLQFYYEALGIRYTVAFGILSFWFVALIVLNFLGFRRDQIVPLALAENFEGLVKEKRFQEAYELVKADESYLGKILSAGMSKLQSGYSQAMEAMTEVGEEESLKIEQRLSYVAMVGTIAPMVGLLGTVDGMVASFMQIADNPNTPPKPHELAGGISMALITTLAGLVLAIPAIMIFGYFRNRMAKLFLEVGIVSENLMSNFPNAKKG